MPYIVNGGEDTETFEERHQRFISLINDVKSAWLDGCSEFEKLITNSDVDKRSYSSRYLPSWLEKITNWAEEDTQDYQLPKEIIRFSQATLHEKSKSGVGPEHQAFIQIDQLLTQSLTIKDLIIPLAITEVRQSIAHEKHRRGEMGFDDLLTRLDKALKNEGGQFLAE
ncbi:exodeoxyribonuclease V subunit beta, partial [Escherichia coli]